MGCYIPSRQLNTCVRFTMVPLDLANTSMEKIVMRKRILSLAQGALCLGLTVIATGCYNVTIRPEGGFKIASKPTFEQRQDFYLWGLVGESHIDTSRVCSKNGPAQMQSEMTVVDALLGLVTLGIYSPETAKIWCK